MGCFHSPVGITMEGFVQSCLQRSPSASPCSTCSYSSNFPFSNLYLAADSSHGIDSFTLKTDEGCWAKDNSKKQEQGGQEAKMEKVPRWFNSRFPISILSSTKSSLVAPPSSIMVNASTLVFSTQPQANVALLRRHKCNLPDLSMIVSIS